jgi:lipoate-protein ligase A
LVPHDADWTYSVAIPPSHPWYALKAAQSYARMHEWIRCAFERLGVKTELAPVSRKELPGQCFAGYEQFDLLLGGRKIAGAAQRRAKEGLLLQGSVQPPPRGVARSDWEAAMRQAAAENWNAQWADLEPTRQLLDRAGSLAAAKYSRADYNGRR